MAQPTAHPVLFAEQQRVQLVRYACEILELRFRWNRVALEQQFAWWRALAAGTALRSRLERQWLATALTALSVTAATRLYRQRATTALRLHVALRRQAGALGTLGAVATRRRSLHQADDVLRRARRRLYLTRALASLSLAALEEHAALRACCCRVALRALRRWVWAQRTAARQLVVVSLRRALAAWLRELEACALTACAERCGRQGRQQAARRALWRLAAYACAVRMARRACEPVLRELHRQHCALCLCVAWWRLDAISVGASHERRRRRQAHALATLHAAAADRGALAAAALVMAHRRQAIALAALAATAATRLYRQRATTALHLHVALCRQAGALGILGAVATRRRSLHQAAEAVRTSRRTLHITRALASLSLAAADERAAVRAGCCRVVLRALRRRSAGTRAQRAAARGMSARWLRRAFAAWLRVLEARALVACAARCGRQGRQQAARRALWRLDSNARAAATSDNLRRAAATDRARGALHCLRSAAEGGVVRRGRLARVRGMARRRGLLRAVARWATAAVASAASAAELRAAIALARRHALARLVAATACAARRAALSAAARRRRLSSSLRVWRGQAVALGPWHRALAAAASRFGSRGGRCACRHAMQSWRAFRAARVSLAACAARVGGAARRWRLHELCDACRADIERRAAHAELEVALLERAASAADVAACARAMRCWRRSFDRSWAATAAAMRGALKTLEAALLLWRSFAAAYSLGKLRWRRLGEVVERRWRRALQQRQSVLEQLCDATRGWQRDAGERWQRSYNTFAVEAVAVAHHDYVPPSFVPRSKGKSSPPRDKGVPQASPRTPTHPAAVEGPGGGPPTWLMAAETVLSVSSPEKRN